MLRKGGLPTWQGGYTFFLCSREGVSFLCVSGSWHSPAGPPEDHTAQPKLRALTHGDMPPGTRHWEQEVCAAPVVAPVSLILALPSGKVAADPGGRSIGTSSL